jgi:hypothetical protein
LNKRGIQRSFQQLHVYEYEYFSICNPDGE